MSQPAVAPAPRRSLGRRLLALTLAPLVMPLLSMYRYNYMLNQPLKFWQSVLMYALASYVASTLVSAPVLLWFELVKRRPSARAVVSAFVLGSGALGLAAGAASAASDGAFSIKGVIAIVVIGALSGLAISATYCAIAGVPWRPGRNGEPQTSRH